MIGMDFDKSSKIMFFVAIIFQLIFLGLIGCGLWIVAKYLGVI